MTHKQLLYLFFLVGLFSCGQNTTKEKPYNESRELVPNPEGYKKDSPMTAIYDSTLDRWKFKKYLTDPKTPKLAKQIFNDNWTLEDEALVFISYLTDKDKEARPFYFRVVTNTYKKSDGAVSEGLGNGGYEYVKNNPKEFANYFIGKNSFTDNDLKTWADIVMLELQLIDENEIPKKEPIVENYTKVIKQNCKTCTKDESIILNKFEDILKEKWREYLTHIDK
jgi:hypothetical protein